MFKFLGKSVLRLFWWLTKVLLKFAATVTVIVCLILLAGNFWIPTATEITLNRLSGFKTTVEKSRGSIYKGQLDLRALEVRNPRRTFKYERFIFLNRLVADVDITSLLKDTIVIEELAVDIGDITAVKNSKGVNNYSLFLDNIQEAVSKSRHENNDAKTPAAKSTPSTKNKSILIKSLTLAIGTVHIVDEKTDTTKEYEINYRREFKDVSDFSKLGKQIIADPKLIKHGLPIILDSVISSMSGLPGAAIDAAMKTKNVSVDTVSKVVDKVGSKIGSGIKKLFGK